MLLRGVNVNALAEYWQYGAFRRPSRSTRRDADRDRRRSAGTSCACSSRGRASSRRRATYDEAYLDQVETRSSDLLARRGRLRDHRLPPGRLGTDARGAPGRGVPAPTEPRSAGTARRAGRRSTAARRAASRSRDPRAEPGRARVLRRVLRRTRRARAASASATRYARMLGHVAARFAGDESVAGYDLMNEPNAFTRAAGTALAAPLRGRASARSAPPRRRAAGFPHLVVFEPSALWSDFGTRRRPPDFARDRNVVYAPHIYTGGINGGPITARRLRARARRRRRASAVRRCWSASGASDPRRATDPADVYFLSTRRLQDEFRFGATLWTWRESCGDPHKAGDIRAGQRAVRLGRVRGRLHDEHGHGSAAGPASTS